MKRNVVLPIIVLAQFAGTSYWFAVNAVMKDLQLALNISGDATGMLTSAIQLGFISGTLVFAVLSIADRFSPSMVFLFSAVVGAIFNAMIAWFDPDFVELIILRFLAGFFLAGIYPVGMKIAADWFPEGLGKALGFLVGALVLGKSFPHGLKAFGVGWAYQDVILFTSACSVIGGLLLFLLVGDGPARKPSSKFAWNTIPRIFRAKAFRSAAFGYFGHMWELYTLWAFIPLLISLHPAMKNISMWSFFIIGIGSLGCILGGLFSVRIGSRKVALYMLMGSGILCFISPWLNSLPIQIYLIFMLIWGFTVVGDSPQFSTMVAKTCPKEYVGTALTIVNCIGFSITIISLQLITWLQEIMAAQYLFWLLLPGPLFGIWAIGFKRRNMHKN